MKVALMMHDVPLRTSGTAVIMYVLICRTIRIKIPAVRSDTTVDRSGLQINHHFAVTFMSSQDSQHLHALLNAFDAERLGEGDPVAGANLLVAMACSLANLQRPGSGFVTRDGQSIAVGTSMLVSGSFSTSLISERVLTGLAMRQTTLTSRFCRRSRGTGGEAGNSGSNHGASSDLAANWAEAVMHQLCEPGAIGDQQATECWGAVLQVPARTDLSYLRDHPVVFAAGNKPAELAAQLERSHAGRPLIHMGIDGIGDFARFEHLCPAVIDGRMMVGPMLETVRGMALVTDPNEILGEAVRNNLASARWTSRLLWLVDGNAGPGLGDIDDDESQVRLGGIERRFETAMGLAWGNRISDRVTRPLMFECEFGEIQARWVAFLKRLEPVFPGITGNARNLLATLWFGLQQMVDAAKAPEGFRMPVEQVEAFARFMIHRMTNARAVMLELAELTRRRQLETSIVNKLAGGPLLLRELSRKFYRLPSVTCHELLLDLEASGKVVQIGNKWQLARSGLLTVARDRELVLEA